VDDGPPVLSPQELFNRLSRSVFVVEALDTSGSVIALGSGVAVAPNQVVTNRHVMVYKKLQTFDQRVADDFLLKTVYR